MNGQNAVREAMNGRGPIMVVIREQEGFRVYAATNPHAVEHVGGTPQAPTCSLLCAPSCLAPWARQGSAAPRRGASSCTRTSRNCSRRPSSRPINRSASGILIGNADSTK